MEFKDLKLKSVMEVQRLLQEKREQLRDRRFKVTQGHQKDVRELRELKRDIARLLTKMNQVPAVAILPNKAQTK